MTSYQYGDASIIDIQSLKPDTDFVILILGCTGAGKTTFIENVTGLKLGVNDSLDARATDIRMVALNVLSADSDHPHRIVFIDTPGYDSCSEPLFDIVNVEPRIKAYLDDLKAVNVAIRATIYLIPIDHADLINHRKKYEVERSTHFSVPNGPPAPPTSQELAERILQRVSKWKMYYMLPITHRPLLFLTTNWLSETGVCKPDSPSDRGIQWEGFAREDLARGWEGKIFNSTFKLGRLSAEIESARENLAAIVDLSMQTSAPLPLVQDSVDAELCNQDIIIAVMGRTGSGKSTFIKTATGADPGINHNLKSTQNGVKIVTMQHPQFRMSRIVLVDTPGFDDTTRSDLEIFQLISSWLEHSYGKNIQLSGIIYTHRITDNRMAGSAMKNFNMLRKICGKDVFSKVLFITTMWDEQNEESRVACLAREKQLEKEVFKPFLDKGAKLQRQESAGDSAFALNAIGKFTADAKRALLLQKELVDYKKALQMTQAGQAIYNKLDILILEQEQAVEQQQSARERQDLQRRIEELKNDLQQLKLPLPPFFYNLFYWAWHGVPWETSVQFWSKPAQN